jgi:hypothetical protein
MKPIDPLEINNARLFQDVYQGFKLGFEGLDMSGNGESPLLLRNLLLRCRKCRVNRESSWLALYVNSKGKGVKETGLNMPGDFERKFAIFQVSRLIGNAGGCKR